MNIEAGKIGPKSDSVIGYVSIPNRHAWENQRVVFTSEGDFWVASSEIVWCAPEDAELSMVHTVIEGQETLHKIASSVKKGDHLHLGNLKVPKNSNAGPPS